MSEAAPESGFKATILVADDDPAILDMVSRSLRKRAYRVISAIDGKEAIAQARGRRPQLVVLDVMMPQMSGWEVARALRQDPDTASIKIVMLTAIGKVTNEMTSPLYGADAYLDKPFEFAELERIIDELLTAG
jgi:CheY-like chemotaxis protein